MNKKDYIFLLIGNLLNSLLYGLYMCSYANEPTLSAHLLQWVSLFGGMSLFTIHGIYYERFIIPDKNKGTFGKLGLLIVPFFVCIVGYIIGYHLI